jgi:hypothetical protein
MVPRDISYLRKTSDSLSRDLLLYSVSLSNALIITPIIAAVAIDSGVRGLVKICTGWPGHRLVNKRCGTPRFRTLVPEIIGHRRIGLVPHSKSGVLAVSQQCSTPLCVYSRLGVQGYASSVCCLDERTRQTGDGDVHIRRASVTCPAPTHIALLE